MRPVICLVDHPGPDVDPSVVLEVLHRAELMAAPVWQATLGHDDFGEPAASHLDWLGNQTWVRKRVMVALDRPVAGLRDSGDGLPHITPDTDLADAKVIGSTLLNQSRSENTHMLGSIEIAVALDQQRRGVGSAMVAALEQVARTWGATTLSGWSTQRGLATHDAIMPAEGPFGVSGSAPATAFAVAHGFELAQTERWSVQALGADLPRCGDVTVPDGYALEVWNGPMRADLAPDIAAMMTAFEASVPSGELDVTPETYTAERVLAGNATMHKTSDSVSVLARHVASGEPVAQTELTRYKHKRDSGFQGITVVLPEHRGHGLGRTIKLAAMHEARRVWPHIDRIHTWNAGENDHMWAISESLGYETAGVCGAWQKKLA